MSGLLEDILAKLDSIESIAHGLLHMQPVSGSSVVATGLDEISTNLGLVKAGEFRSGTGIPGDTTHPFTGVRMGAPGWLYSGERYSIVGLNADVIQFGLSNEDGKIYAGAGNVTISSLGVNLTSITQYSYFPPITTNSRIGWLDVSGNVLATITDAFYSSGGRNYDILEINKHHSGSGFATKAVQMKTTNDDDTDYAAVYVEKDLWAVDATFVLLKTVKSGNTGTLKVEPTLTSVSTDITLSGALTHTGATAGFYNHAVTAQQVLATGVSHSVDDVITALQNLGLVKQS